MSPDDVRRFRERHVPHAPPSPYLSRDDAWESESNGLTVRKLFPKHPTPFGQGVAGFNPEWWEKRVWTVEPPDVWYLSFDEADEEVARAIVVENVLLHPKYDGLNDAGPHVEIVRFEVRDGLRGKGIGSRAVHAIVEQFPGRRLFALSEGADGFWAHCRWTQLRRTDRDPLAFPTFSVVSPARQTRPLG